MSASASSAGADVTLSTLRMADTRSGSGTASCELRSGVLDAR
jgi:hypothetical protein